VKTLLELFKVKQTLLLLLTGVLSYVAASGSRVDWPTLAVATLSFFLTISGTTGFNMVLDADIDAAMFRTRNRPIPSGRMDRRTATVASASALLLGLLLASAINPYFLAAALAGFLINIVVYTVLLKRRSPWSVVFGGFAGGMPALGGWAAATGSFGPGGLLLMLLVALWSSLHIWTLATYYADDYRRAGVPMLPAVYGERVGVQASLLVAALVAGLTALLWAQGLLSVIGLAVSLAPLAAASALLARGLAVGEYRWHSFRAFKLVNMYMAVVFISAALLR
jgi:protoheme IX farnesyltransferase